MMKKIIAASFVLVMLAAIAPMALADGSDVQPYNGWIGADSPLYPIKIFAQNVDIFLTFDNTARMEKQMALADERLSEAQAMILANNAAGTEAALDQYQDALDALNQTAEAPDINDTEYANLSPMLYHHQQCFYAMMNNSTVPMTIEGRLMTACNKTIKMKNGMPFYYYNGTSYFIPPGQMKLITNGSKVPPGLAKKGYVRPVPTITNGSLTWPWDEINYSYGNMTMPTVPAMPTMPAMNNNGKGNGKGNGHGNGNGNGNGHGNGNNK